MYTQCPSCGAIFALRAWQLRKASGTVVCGLCRSEFDAMHGLAETLPEGLEDPFAATPAPNDATTELSHSRPPPFAALQEEGGGASRSERSPKIADEDSEERLSAPLDERDFAAPEVGARPSDGRANAATDLGPLDLEAIDLEQAVEALQGRRGRRRPTAHKSRAKSAQGRRLPGGRWTVVLLAAAVLLVGGVHAVYHFRTDLAAFPALQPWLETVCRLYNCSLVTRSSYEVIDVEERWLEAHPHREDALILGAIMVHRGERRLPYPDLELMLRNLDGQTTLSGWVVPEDYVADSRLRVRLDAGMEPGVRIPVRLEVAEPEQGATSFTLAFRPPQ